MHCNVVILVLRQLDADLIRKQDGLSLTVGPNHVGHEVPGEPKDPGDPGCCC